MFEKSCFRLASNTPFGEIVLIAGFLSIFVVNILDHTFDLEVMARPGNSSVKSVDGGIEFYLDWEAINNCGKEISLDNSSKLIQMESTTTKEQVHSDFV